MSLPPGCTCSWLSDYQEAKPFLKHEKANFHRAVQQLRPLAEELLVELRQNVSAYQASGVCIAAGWQTDAHGAEQAANSHKLSWQQIRARVFQLTSLSSRTLLLPLQVDDPPEAVGPYCYRTHFTPQGTQTITRTNSQGGHQARQQVVVSDAVLQTDLAAVAASGGLKQPLPGIIGWGSSSVCPWLEASAACVCVCVPARDGSHGCWVRKPRHDGSCVLDVACL